MLKKCTGAAIDVADAFSTTLYTGDGSNQYITTGIDLVAYDGLVWIKNRDAADSHILTDTLRGAGNVLSSDTTAVATTDADTITAFGNDDFSLGNDVKVNTNTEDYVSWTFRKARKFFDVATVTKSSGADATIEFPTLNTLGMVTVKRTDNTGSWYTWHKDLSAGKLLYLEQTAAEATLGHITVSGTTVTLENGVIADGDYVAYAWAHDTETEGIIQCGSYTGNGSTTGPEIDLGWTPQYVVLKHKSGTYGNGWCVWDAARSTTDPRTSYLVFDDNTQESLNSITFRPYGFRVITTSNTINASGSEFIYLAIREES
jgi:hypothetical protein